MRMRLNTRKINAVVSVLRIFFRYSGCDPARRNSRDVRYR